MTTTSSHSAAVTYSGDNLDAVTDLGVHVIPHPTQAALVVFAAEGDLDPIGVLAVGQHLLVDDHGPRIAGAPDAVLVELPAEDLFDPSKASVEEVVEYLQNLDDTDEGRAEADRVLAAEKAGKNRKTLVGDGE
jgi:hypothetical protein